MAIKPIKVSQLNGYIKRILQSDPLLGNVAVIGEVSNMKYHGSGHVYFTLKENNSKINCFLPSEYVKNLRYQLIDGMEITVNGYIYLYEKGGTYSLNVRDISVEGMGNLSIAFTTLKEKLEKEGLFDAKYKKPISAFPERIVVITSDTGAAVRDIIKTIQTRNHFTHVLLYPCLVQGQLAAADISSAITQVNKLFPETDTIILGRGGGSLEELWPFNEELVARSIFLSRIPIISAVGHETDFTISDFVADLRAPTPTAAAQTAVPDIGSLKENCNRMLLTMHHNLNQGLEYYMLKLENNNRKALSRLLLHRFDMEELRLQKEKEKLSALNPLSVIMRGYGMVLNQNNQPISSTKSVLQDDLLTVVLKDGELVCQVKQVNTKDKGERIDGKKEGRPN